MEFAAKLNLQEESTRELSSAPGGGQVMGWGAVSIRTFDSEKNACVQAAAEAYPQYKTMKVSTESSSGPQNRGMTF